MTKIKGLLCCIAMTALSTGFTNAWSYPVDQISKTSCKWEPWSSHTSDCKMSLPKIKNGDYKNYVSNITYRLVYSVLWAATYDNGWDFGKGGHLGVDIATAQGTPVYSIGDGKVVIASTLSGRGKTVVIQHNFKGNKIYSVYAHLNSIGTSVGKSIDEGDKIGEVGSTGNSTGNHLHFQIDISYNGGSHPYYYGECNISGISNKVNSTACQNFVTTHTIDPIYFIETNGQGIKSVEAEAVKEENIQRQEEQEIEESKILTREELRLTELELFLARYDLTVESKIPSNILGIGETGKIYISGSKKHKRKELRGLLPEDITFTYDSEIIEVDPKNGIRYIDGTREIEITGKKEGSATIGILMGGRDVGTFHVRVANDSTVVEPVDGQILEVGNYFIGTNNWGIGILKDEKHNKIINIKYSGNYTIQSDENTKLCALPYYKLEDISKMKSYSCNKENLENSITFNRTKSTNGLYLFKIYPLVTGYGNLELYKNYSEKLYTTNKKKTSLPTDLDKTSKYYSAAISMLTKGIVTNEKTRYFAPTFDLRETDAILWIENLFGKESNIKGSKYTKLTRLEFMKLFSQITLFQSSNTNSEFRDIKNGDKTYGNILADFGIKFLDDFGDNYFQPEKLITREEAAYILSKIEAKM